MKPGELIYWEIPAFVNNRRCIGLVLSVHPDGKTHEVAWFACASEGLKGVGIRREDFYLEYHIKLDDYEAR